MTTKCFQAMTESQISEQSLSCSRKILILVLSLAVHLAYGMNNSLPSPFFPTEAQSHGVSQTTVGIIVAALNVSIVASSVFMLLVSPEKMKRWFCLGAMTSGAMCLAFGELINGPPGTIFALLSIATRIIMGFGNAAISSSGVPILLPLFLKRQGRVMSLIEFMMCVGEMSGPPVASLLYSLGGYTLPFRTVGTFELLLGICCFCVIPSRTNKVNQVDSPTVPGQSMGTCLTQVPALKFVTSPGIWIVSLPILTCSAFMGFLIAAFSPYLLTEFGIKQDTAGLYFLPYSLVNTIGAVFLGELVDKGYGGFICCLGAIGNTISFLLLALPMFRSLNYLASVHYIEAVLSFSGFSFVSIMTTVFFLFIKVGQRETIASTEQLKIFSATWFTFSFSLGLSYGQAFVGGVFFENFWFYGSCLLQEFTSLVTTFIFITYMVKNNLVWTNNMRDENEDELHPICLS